MAELLRKEDVLRAIGALRDGAQMTRERAAEADVRERAARRVECYADALKAVRKLPVVRDDADGRGAA